MKRLAILAFLLDLLITLPAAAAGPSTSEDWQKLYEACFQGAQTVARARFSCQVLRLYAR